MNILIITDVSFRTPSSGSEQVLYYQVTGLVKRKLNVFAITRWNGNSSDVEYSNSERLQIGCYGADVNKP